MALRLLMLQTWLRLSLPNGHQFPQSSPHITFMLHILLYTYTHTYVLQISNLCTTNRVLLARQKLLPHQNSGNFLINYLLKICTL